MKRSLAPHITEKQELNYARAAIFLAVLVAGYFGINPPGFVAEVVAFAFGLAAASFFPAIVLGIFYRRMNRQGAIAGMLSGFTFTAAYIIYFKFIRPELSTADHWWFGISPEGIGTMGTLVNLGVALVVCRFTPAPPQEVQEIVHNIRLPGENV
jgi:cation/acetate symporter